MSAHDDLARVVEMVRNTRAARVDGVSEGHNAAIALDALLRVKLELDELDERVECLQVAVLYLEEYKKCIVNEDRREALAALVLRCARERVALPNVPEECITRGQAAPVVEPTEDEWQAAGVTLVTVRRIIAVHLRELGENWPLPRPVDLARDMEIDESSAHDHARAVVARLERSR